jgi:hypothetical protein
MDNHLSQVERSAAIARDMDERREEEKIRDWFSVTREFEDALCALNELYYEAHRRCRDGYPEFGRLCRDFDYHFKAVESLQTEWQDTEDFYGETE